MLRLLAAATPVLLLGLALCPATAVAENFLEMSLEMDAGRQFGIFPVIFGKTGAQSCELRHVDPAGVGETYACELADARGETEEVFIPEQRFFDDHMSLSFDELIAAIRGDWALVWDLGLATETIATIDFGADRDDIVPEAWPDVFPNILNPEDGAAEVPSGTSIDWDYGPVDPSDVDRDAIRVFLTGPDNEYILFDLADECETTSCTPARPLTPGDWVAVVSNGVGIRDARDGISTSGDPWVLANAVWLSLGSVDRAAFTVPCFQMDFVCDGIINILDVQSLLNHFGETPAEPGYDAQFDLVADDVINILDVQSLLNHFGEGACGLGFELVFLLPVLRLLRRGRLFRAVSGRTGSAG